MFTRRIFLLLILSLASYLLRAQPSLFGLQYIQNYHYAETGGGEQNWGIARDQRGLIYVANNDNGILEFDGSSWRTIPVPGSAAVRSVVAGNDGFIYAGLDGDFGRLEPDRRGHLQYRSLLDSAGREMYSEVAFWRTYYREDQVYFCGMQSILVYAPALEEISVIDPPPNAFLTFFLGPQMYSSNYESGLMKFAGEGFLPVKGGGQFRGKNISGLVAMDSGQLLVSTFFHKLYLLDTLQGTVDSTFLEPALMEELISAQMIFLQNREKDVYIGTRANGLYILNDRWELKKRISENEGLLDNAIPYFIFDEDPGGEQALWIAHWKGVSRVNLHCPFHSVSVGQSSRGMYGRGRGELITDLDQFAGDFFVSTLDGLQQQLHDQLRFRPIRGVRGEIYDLQVMEPSPGIEYLLAIGTDRTYLLDNKMQISTIPAGGRKLLADRNNPGIFYTGSDPFKAFQFINGQWKEVLNVEINREILNMSQDRQGFIWISSRRGLLRLELKGEKEPELRNFGAANGLPAGSLEVFTDPVSRELLVGSKEGFFRFDYMQDTLLYDSLYNSLLPDGKNNIKLIHKGADNLFWFSFENEDSGWNILAARQKDTGFQQVHERILRVLSSRVPTDVFYTDSEKQLWFSKAAELIHFDESQVVDSMQSYQVLMRNVKINGDSLLFDGTYFSTSASGQLLPETEQTGESRPRLKHDFRDIEFLWSALYFQNQRQMQYSYYLEGFSRDWSEWSRERSAKYTNLPYGRYEMKVKARNVFGDESPLSVYEFSILKPWYVTFAAVFLYFILIASLVIFVILYTRKLKTRAELLEKQNREIELQKQELELLNEETTAQRDEIERQRDSLSEQKELIDRQNSAMTDSIIYARRIQDAVLPANEVMRFLLPKHFVFYLPRDIVSGDFFWVDKRDETILVAVADCTGHGVPGAFMSMLGISLLNEISSKFTDSPTNEIMDELRDLVIAALGQTGDRYETKDGIEMSLVAINTKTREVQFTGANHNLYTFQKGELVILKGDRMPVGIHSESSTLFSVSNLRLNRGDTLYMLSDGFIDQFGGKHRKKYGTQRFKTLLSQLQNSIMLDQKAAVEKAYEEWKGVNEQIDDVLMIGIKL
ncbi:MAG: SpoIIE family protein phosphatase [Bacteroidales bacterium]|nr:SpoIIE family protein phosphatase [Bacteroidales bacterium]